MEYNSGVSMILPDSIGLIENDFDDDREQTNQNEIVELIMAAFEGHDEPSDDDDGGSLNSTDSSHQSSDEQQTINTNNNNEPNDSRHQQNDPHQIPVPNNKTDNSFNPNAHVVHYKNVKHELLPNTPASGFHYGENFDLIDPLQAQYFYQTSTNNLSETQNQLNKLRILCSVKDRKASQLQNLCEEFREKYQNDTRALQHQLELSERSKYDWEQRYQLKNTQYEDLIQTNNQLNRTIKDSELKFQHLEAVKNQFEKKFSDSESMIESLHRKVNELLQYESIARSQHDYERILSTTRDKHEQEITAFNEKLENIQMNLLEKNIEIDDLRAQLEIANKNLEKAIFERMETVNHLNEQLHESQRKYADLLTSNSLETLHQVEKEKFERKCQELEAEIRTLREQLNKTEINHVNFVNVRDSLDDSTIDQSIITENIRLKERLNEYIFKEKQLRELNDELQRMSSKRSDSSSSSSSSNETVITASVHMEQIRKLTAFNEKLKNDLSEIQEKQEYEKQELYTIIEQLREDVNELDKTKQLYIDLCQEKNTMEDTLTSKLDDLHRKHQEEIDKLKIKHEKQIHELNNELDRLRCNDDANSRLIYTEKEFDQLKHDYYNLNLKHTDLLKTCAKFENENENLLNSLEQIKREKILLTQKFENDIKQLTSQQKQELFSLHQKTDQNQINLEGDIESLQTRIKNYENTIAQYEEYRLKLENNIQKIIQQRDTNKVELRVTKEMLTNKENDYNQLKIQFDQCEKHLQTHKEQFRQYESTISELEQHNRDAANQEKLRSLEAEKCRLEQSLQEANRALDLADSHLQQEIEKIKISLEQEYKRRYERDHRQHQSPLNFTSNSNQDIEEIKKMYRTEIDRLYRENIELNQQQTKLIDAHQKQMQNMKKDLDEGYKNVINEFQREQVRSQTRYDQLKQQLTDSLQTIEQLKLNLNQIKANHSEEISKIKQEHNNENRTRQNLLKLLEQSSDTLSQERTIRARQDTLNQQTINSLQKKVADITKQYTKTIDDLKRELNNERLLNQNNHISRPISVPDFTSNNSSTVRSEYLTTVEKLRELFTNEMIALLRLTCKMIFDVHHQVTVVPCMNNLDISMKKQIQSELIRSRNSMIKEIRREISEKTTYALRSQGVPNKIIDMHIFELNRLLSQMIQECLNSLPVVSPSASNSSLNITPQTSAISPPRKTVELLYITPTSNKKPAPLAPHHHAPLDHIDRQKSASNNFLANQSQNSTSSSSSYVHKYQRANNKNIRIKMHRSEDDIIHAMEYNEKHVNSFNDDGDTSTLCEEDVKREPSKVQLLAKQFETQANSSLSRTQIKSPTQETRYATTQIINHKKHDNDNDDDDELTWPSQPIPTIPSTQSNGIKKFVRNSLKLFIAQPQQHKRSGK